MKSQLLRNTLTGIPARLVPVQGKENGSYDPLEPCRLKRGPNQGDHVTWLKAACGERRQTVKGTFHDDEGLVRWKVLRIPEPSRRIGLDPALFLLGFQVLFMDDFVLAALPVPEQSSRIALPASDARALEREKQAVLPAGKELLP